MSSHHIVVNIICLHPCLLACLRMLSFLEMPCLLKMLGLWFRLVPSPSLSEGVYMEILEVKGMLYSETCIKQTLLLGTLSSVRLIEGVRSIEVGRNCTIFVN